MRSIFKWAKTMVCALVVGFIMCTTCQVMAESGGVEQRLNNVETITVGQQNQINNLIKDTNVIKEDISLLTNFSNIFVYFGVPKLISQALGVLFVLGLLIWGYFKKVKSKIDKLNSDIEKEKSKITGQYLAFKKTHDSLETTYKETFENNEKLTQLLNDDNLESNNKKLTELIEVIGDGKNLLLELSQMKEAVANLKSTQPTSLEDVLALNVESLRKVAGIHLLPCYARLAMEEGNWEDARFFWNKYLAVVPDDQTSRFYLGWYLLQKGKTAEEIASEDRYSIFIQACNLLENISVMPDLQGHKDYRWSLAEAKLYASFYTDDISRAKRLRGFALNILAEVVESEHPCCPEEAIANFLINSATELRQRHQRLIVASLAMMVCQRAGAKCTTESSFLNEYGCVFFFYYGSVWNRKLQKKILLKAEDKFKKSISLYDQYDSVWNNWGETLRELAVIEQETGAKFQLLSDSIEKMNKAIEINPENDSAWNNWGKTLHEFAKIERIGDEKCKYLNSATEKYSRAVEINPKNHWAWSNWGLVLNNLSEVEQESEVKLQFLNSAVEKYLCATQINPSNDSVWNNWGYACRNIAKIEQDGEVKRQWFNSAVEKFMHATELNPWQDRAWNNWGQVFADLAEIEQDDEPKRQWVNSAVEKFMHAIEINPWEEFGWINWGYALRCLADIEKDVESKRQLLNSAAEKYSQAAGINPVNDYTLSSWGYIFYRLAEIEKDAGLERQWLNSAVETYIHATGINPENSFALSGWGYALRHIASIEQDDEEKLKQLNSAAEKFMNVTEIDPKDSSAWNNWGYTCYLIAEIELSIGAKRKWFSIAEEKCTQATEINKTFAPAWNNCAHALYCLAQIEQDVPKKRQLLNNAIEKLERSIAVGNSSNVVVNSLQKFREELAQLV